MHRFYKAPLPAYIIEKYKNTQSEVVDEQFIRYLNGEKFEIEVKTVVGGHLQNIKSIRSVPVLLRYLKEVLFPGKEFMIDKYGLVSSSEFRVTSKTSEIRNQNSELRTKFWWLWYPYRWFTGLKGFWYVVRGNTEKRKEK